MNRTGARAKSTSAATRPDSPGGRQKLTLWKKFVEIRDIIYILFSSLDNADVTELAEVQQKLGVNGHATDPCTIAKLKGELKKFVMDGVREKETQGVLIDFTQNSLDSIRKQLVQFASIATSERGSLSSPCPSPSREVVQSIDKLLHPLQYAAEPAHVMTSPMKLSHHFPQQYMVRAAIKYQSQIVWDTKDGLPEFHEIWDLPSSQLSSQIRKEALQLELFKYRKLIPAAISPQQACPAIYARLDNGAACSQWQCSLFNSASKKFETQDCSFPRWVTDEGPRVGEEFQGLRTFLHGSEVLTFQAGEHLTANNILYYFVLRDEDASDFRKQKHEEGDQAGPLPSTLQIYIGKARNGVLDRWVFNMNSHSVVTTRLLSHTSQLHRVYTKYRPFRRESEPTLVECCLALAKAKAHHTALFVIHSFSSETEMERMERRLIEEHYATTVFHGLNERTGN